MPTTDPNLPAGPATDGQHAAQPQNGGAALPAAHPDGPKPLEVPLAWAELVTKWIQVPALVATAVWGIHQYRAEESEKATAAAAQETERTNQENARLTADREQREQALRLRWYEEKRPIYLEACSAAAEIATARRLADARAAADRFRALYWGRMCLVEDQATMTQMIRFYRQLEAEADRDGPPSEELRLLALNLAKTCRESLDLQAVFRVTMPVDLDKKKGEAKGHPFPF